MIVVADTTPLISLMKIKKLGLLEKLFGHVQIPEAVYQELVINSFFEQEIQEIKTCNYIHVVKVSEKRAVEILRRATGLDAGESEAIVLMDEQEGNLLLMDEIKGRNIAKQMGMRIMGTIGILLIASEKQIISYNEIVQSVEILRDSGRHIKKDLYEALLEAAKKFQE